MEKKAMIHVVGAKSDAQTVQNCFENLKMMNKGTTTNVLETHEISEALVDVFEKGIRSYICRNKLQLADNQLIAHIEILDIFDSLF